MNISLTSSLECYFPEQLELDSFKESFCTILFKIASYATDPICKVHEYSIKYKMELSDDKISLLFKKSILMSYLIGYSFLACVFSIYGIALRELASKIQNKPFIYERTFGHKKCDNHEFSLLSWNICCVGGGYSISDGGVIPWKNRIDRIIAKILEKDADVNCIYETFDTTSAFYLSQKLKEAGYKELFFNMGSKGIGVSSGILVASKFAIKDPEFTQFSKELLVGRTKNAAKGVFAFDISSDNKKFARIFATHLQHSEEPECPTEEEIEARKKQMELINQKIDQIKDRCVILTGDLNLDRNEAKQSSWYSRFTEGDVSNIRTWKGDHFCAKLMSKPTSSALNLDYTFLLNKSANSIKTEVVDACFDPHNYTEQALSDHDGLFSTICLK